MIVVKIELWPWSYESRSRELGRMYIARAVLSAFPEEAKGVLPKGVTYMELDEAELAETATARAARPAEGYE